MLQLDASCSLCPLKIKVLSITYILEVSSWTYLWTIVTNINNLMLKKDWKNLLPPLLGITSSLNLGYSTLLHQSRVTNPSCWSWKNAWLLEQDLIWLVHSKLKHYPFTKVIKILTYYIININAWCRIKVSNFRAKADFVKREIKCYNKFIE